MFVCVSVHVSNQSRDSRRILSGRANYDLVASKSKISEICRLFVFVASLKVVD